MQLTCMSEDVYADKTVLTPVNFTGYTVLSIHGTTDTFDEHSCYSCS